MLELPVSSLWPGAGAGAAIFRFLTRHRWPLRALLNIAAAPCFAGADPASGPYRGARELAPLTIHWIVSKRGARTARACIPDPGRPQGALKFRLARSSHRRLEDVDIGRRSQ